jgi:2-polyprenyl-6-hydroxyphenyl methylase/3-demethylubiquinone-9 3-methyltransferase
MTQANPGVRAVHTGADTAAAHAAEVDRGARFRFGANWARFLQVLNDDRIAMAVESLRKFLEVDTLDGKSFVDIGSGSGLFSLAARKLGARVHSFDFDPQSVACTTELRARYFPDDPQWKVESGSALDPAYTRALGQFDVVYSWGVLHHTGAMWKGLELAAELVKPGGKLFIALYNDQGRISRFWWRVKKTYNSGLLGRWAVLGVFIPYFTARATVSSIVFRRNTFKSYGSNRGMSIVHDWVDWVGGYPFEVARVEELLEFYKARGFTLTRLRTTNHLACNELVFARSS